MAEEGLIHIIMSVEHHPVLMLMLRGVGVFLACKSGVCGNQFCEIGEAGDVVSGHLGTCPRDCFPAIGYGGGGPVGEPHRHQETPESDTPSGSAINYLGTSRPESFGVEVPAVDVENFFSSRPRVIRDSENASNEPFDAEAGRLSQVSKRPETDPGIQNAVAMNVLPKPLTDKDPGRQCAHDR